jgi:transcriptional regulator NrdR family protein
MEKEQVEREKMERQLHGVSKNLKKAVHERSPQINQTTVHNEIMEKLKSRR